MEGEAERGCAGAVAGEEVWLAWLLLCRPGREGRAAKGVLAGAEGPACVLEVLAGEGAGCPISGEEVLTGEGKE